MKIVMSSDNKPQLQISKSEWEKAGKEKGWLEEKPVVASKLGWTLEKQADSADVAEKPELECMDCSYYGPKADFAGNRCPECKGNHLQPFSAA